MKSRKSKIGYDISPSEYIGYGCKDEGRNEMIKENFDYRNKPSFIIDAYAKDGSQVDLFKIELQAKLLRVLINDISKSLFD